MSPEQHNGRFNEYEEGSEAARVTSKKSQQIEERGSRSPDKKKRRVFDKDDDEPAIGFMNIKRIDAFQDGTPAKQIKKLDYENLRIGPNQASNDSFQPINGDNPI